jgi:2-iminobutanoate/2-iminopropanoate deaminase
MERTVINTAEVPAWPQPLPYSQGVRYGDLVFVSGQLALNPATGGPVEGGIKPQTRQVLENVKAILEAAGSSMDLVLKTTCFLMDRDDFDDFNQVYSEYFAVDQPARSTFQVAKLAPGFIVEIEVIAGARPEE